MARFVALLALLAVLGVTAVPGHAAAELTSPTATRVAAPGGALDFGASVAALGDVNGDGAGDVVVGAPGSGHAYAVSGATSTILYEITAPAPPAPNFGFAVAAVGDLDGDGVTDVAVGAPARGEPAKGEVFLFSGANGALLRRLAPAGGDHVTFGQSVAGTGDVSGDGVPDVIVSASAFAQHAGSVFAFSGADGAQLWSRPAPSPSRSRTAFGRTAVASPDISGDGVADLLVSAPSASSVTPPVASGGDLVTSLLAGVLGLVASAITTPPAGQVHVLSGVDGTMLKSISDPSAAAGDVFGAAMAPMGDQDGDGVVDHLIAEAGANQLHVYSGRDGRLLRSNAAPGGPHSAGPIAVAQTGDQDGDGREDAWVGAAAARTVYLVNGSGAVLTSSPSPASHGSFGAALATLGTGSSGGLEVAVGDPTEPGGGAVYFLHLGPDVALAAEPVLLRVHAQPASSTTVPSTTTTTAPAATTTVPTTMAAIGTGPTATLPKPAAAVRSDAALAGTGGADRSMLGALAIALGIAGITALRRHDVPGGVERG